MIDHLLSFTNEAAAIADPIVGAYRYAADAVFGTPAGWRGDVCIPGVRAVGCAIAWYIYITDDNPALDAHENLVKFATCAALHPLFMGRDLPTVKASAA